MQPLPQQPHPTAEAKQAARLAAPQLVAPQLAGSPQGSPRLLREGLPAQVWPVARMRNCLCQRA
jgi:hypothetical protein